ncbi:P-loop containing nucleoside triphosphate hydrolase protein [Mycena sanguinolenta]|uniref:P-loop containing nucleoside triphosphate hydrolase protein n=1 Tax=Mycena sanguinolenta TaxID=230812 RepID=A0A8H7DJ79_9AGAR|nr:P-loop containing nucleoside triphosphate hydrolase protein [Mycena sanguinolenta]
MEASKWYSEAKDEKVWELSIFGTDRGKNSISLKVFRNSCNKASDVLKYLVFVQSIEQGHRIVHYLRSLLPPHLQKDARRLIRHHHSLACPECKKEGMESLYKCGEDRDCLVHVSTDVLTVGVDIPGLAGVIIFDKMTSASEVTQRAGRPVRERGTHGFAYIYVSEANMAEATAYINSEAGKQDKRVLEAKDPGSHVRPTPVAEPAATEPPESTNAVTPAQPEKENAPAVAAESKKSARTKKTKATPGGIGKPGQRTCTSLLLIFAAHARNRCITRQINMIYANPGVDKDCGRCSSCVGDVVPEPREAAAAVTSAPVEEGDEADKIPAYMKPQVKDLKVVAEKVQNSVRTFRWSQPQRPDGLLSTKIFLPPDIITAITTDFLLIASEEVFLSRILTWKYADEYGPALWNIVKVLVDDLRKELVARHEEALEKQRDGRLHKWIVAEKLDSIKRVRLTLPVHGTIPVVGLNDRAISPEHFYLGSPEKAAPKGQKRKAAEPPQPAKPSKRSKQADKENSDPKPVPARKRRHKK